MRKTITNKMVERYCSWLAENEKSRRTIERYRHHLKGFLHYIEGKVLDKIGVLLWKEQLKKNFAPVTVNSALAALNGFFKFFGWINLTVRYIKIKKNVFCPEEKELHRDEYERLIRAALKQKNERLALLIQTVCATGIRISELKYITVEAVEEKRALVECKGGICMVFMPTELCQQLKMYAGKKRITSGMVFVMRTGHALDRCNIWREMKQLAELANVQAEKIFPHNLRHLFARAYYSQEKDLSRLADILGHSNVNTTKIYTIESGEKHIRQIEQLGLLLPDYNRISLLL